MMPKAEDQITSKPVSMMKVLTAQPPRMPASRATAPAPAPRSAERRAKLRRMRRARPEGLEDRGFEGARLLTRRRRPDQHQKPGQQRGRRPPARRRGNAFEKLRHPVDRIRDPNGGDVGKRLRKVAQDPRLGFGVA